MIGLTPDREHSDFLFLSMPVSLTEEDIYLLFTRLKTCTLFSSRGFYYRVLVPVDFILLCSCSCVYYYRVRVSTGFVTAFVFSRV